jgi:flavin reductase (DIM6/NTAB) family NADH-FMN oxidoreductase RutF
MPENPIVARPFDAFTEGLDLPMYIVTVASAGQRAGCLVGFVTQASMTPPRLLVCLSEANDTYRVATRAGVGVLAVHLLSSRQHELAALFGGATGDMTDKFARCAWEPGPEGVPILLGCRRHLIGRVVSRHPFGDHTGFLLDPTTVEGGDIAPLRLADVEDIDPGHPVSNGPADDDGSSVR